MRHECALVSSLHQNRHGYLTYALVEEGLKTSRADLGPRDGQVTAREWIGFAAGGAPQIRQELPRAECTRPPHISDGT